MSKRYVCFQDAVQLILAERDKIPKTVPGMGYEFGLPQPNYSGNLIRGGIKKALKVLETMPKADADEVVRCRDCCFYIPTKSETLECGIVVPVYGGYCSRFDSVTVHGFRDGMPSTDKTQMWMRPDDFCSRGERREVQTDA